MMILEEIDKEKIQDTWLNRHLKYTHGYGIALSRVDAVTQSGQPACSGSQRTNQNHNHWNRENFSELLLFDVNDYSNCTQHRQYAKSSVETTTILSSFCTLPPVS